MKTNKRKEMGYWFQNNLKKQPIQTKPEKIKCKRCGNLISLGSLPYISRGEGLICKNCHDKKWRKFKKIE